MDAKALRAALRSVGTRRSAERAAPLLSEEACKRLGIQISVPEGEDHSPELEDDDED